MIPLLIACWLQEDTAIRASKSLQKRFSKMDDGNLKIIMRTGHDVTQQHQDTVRGLLPKLDDIRAKSSAHSDMSMLERNKDSALKSVLLFEQHRVFEPTSTFFGRVLGNERQYPNE